MTVLANNHPKTFLGCVIQGITLKFKATAQPGHFVKKSFPWLLCGKTFES